MGEFCPDEARVLGECRPVEVCGLGECHPAEVRGLGECRPAEVRTTVERGRRKITFLNRDFVERIENGRSAEIEIKVTPGSSGLEYVALLIPREGATALAHLNEDSAAYVLLFVELCIVCGDIFRRFIILTIWETFD